jgi:hypothetical protein
MTISLQKSVLSAVGALALLFNSGAAFSASSASAWIDWSTFKITPISVSSGLPIYSLSDEYSEVGVVSASDWDNWEDTQYGTAYDWTSPISGSLASSKAQADASELIATAKTSDGDFEAFTLRSATIEAAGSGILLFSVDYAISAEIDGDPLDFALALVFFEAELLTVDGWESTSAYSQVHLEGSWSAADLISKSKTLTLSLLVNEGDIISFSANSYANVSAVPVPAAIWFLGTALVGLISVGRRTKAA